MSVVLLSRGPAQQLERALSCVQDSVRSLGAQLVVVREDDAARDRVKHLAQQHRCTVTFSTAGGGLHQLSDEGMKLVTGDIVAVREDARVRDAAWLHPFARMMPQRVQADVEVAVVIGNERALRHAPPERAARVDSRRREGLGESLS